MQYVMELKASSGPSMGLSPRWQFYLHWLSLAYICFGVLLLNKSLLVWGGDNRHCVCVIYVTLDVLLIVPFPLAYAGTHLHLLLLLLFS